MTVVEVKERLSKGTVELIDIRTDQERDEIDIGGIHIEADELEENLDLLKKGLPKVFYCSLGKRSGETVKALIKTYPDLPIHSLQGGLKAWFAR